MDISLAQARQLFTQKLVATYRERPVVMSFLRSFFTNNEGSTKYVSIEVQRGNEKVAVDVQRSTEGNRNEFSKASQKILLPPYYREFFDATDLDIYDMLFASQTGSVNARTFASWVSQVVEKIGLMQDKIERAYELQCAQVLEDGIVTLNNGDNIDFKRVALSKVDLSANPWDNAATDPIAQLLVGCNFLRTKGKAQGGVFNLICASDALAAFINNTIVKSRADIKNFSLDMIRMPQRNAVGGTLHGEVSVGAYKVRIWSYPEYYDNSSGVSTPYMTAKKVVLIPEAPKFTLAFAAVPLLLRDTNKAEFAQFIDQAQGAYVIGNYIDERASAHIFDIKSAGVAVPVAVDQIWTAQVLA